MIFGGTGGGRRRKRSWECCLAPEKAIRDALFSRVLLISCGCVGQDVIRSPESTLLDIVLAFLLMGGVHRAAEACLDIRGVEWR